MRIGFGFDVHQLVAGRDFILGGVNIPSEKGILGHSDADVLLHAISDAILGALALGDIGVHFPDTRSENKGIDSKIILEKCIQLASEKWGNALLKFVGQIYLKFLLKQLPTKKWVLLGEKKEL